MEQQNTTQQFPSEEVTLPSKGLLYPEGHPLRSGIIEMKYMTTKEEDILTNTNYINNGTVIDKLLKSLIISPINFDELLIGDKNAVLVASRILGYGQEYSFKYKNPSTGDEDTGETAGDEGGEADAGGADTEMEPEEPAEEPEA